MYVGILQKNNLDAHIVLGLHRAQYLESRVLKMSKYFLSIFEYFKK